jgi:hypothetical protein
MFKIACTCYKYAWTRKSSTGSSEVMEHELKIAVWNPLVYSVDKVVPKVQDVALYKVLILPLKAWLP